MFDDRRIKFAMIWGHRGVIEVSLGSRLEWLKLVWLNIRRLGRQVLFTVGFSFAWLLLAGKLLKLNGWILKAWMVHCFSMFQWCPQKIACNPKTYQQLGLKDDFLVLLQFWESAAGVGWPCFSGELYLVFTPLTNFELVKLAAPQVSVVANMHSSPMRIFQRAGQVWNWVKWI